MIFAQKNILKASAIIGNLGVQYERSIAKQVSLIGQIGQSSVITTVDDTETTHKGVGYYLEGRYYISKEKDNMEGWHIGPYFNNINTENSENLKTTITSLGFSSGYQWVFNSRITLEFIFGGGTLDFESKSSDFKFFGDFDFFPHFGFSMGYSF